MGVVCVFVHVCIDVCVYVCACGGDTRRGAQSEVRVAAGETLSALAACVRSEDLGPHVLTLVLQLAHDNEQVRC